MNSNVHEGDRHATTVRAWQLAILRFAVTLDNADRLAVMAIANEIDKIRPQHDGKPAFDFFRRTSAQLCAAILQPDEQVPPSCNDITRVLKMTASNASSRRQPGSTSRRCFQSASLSSKILICGEGFPGAAIRSKARLHGISANSRAARGCRLSKMLFAPFRPGTTHVVLFRAIFTHRPIPGWTQKRHDSAKGAAEQGSRNRGGE
jgi:hypothetical protein